MPIEPFEITLEVLAEAEKRFVFDFESGVLRYRLPITKGRNPKAVGDVLGSRSANGEYRARTWLLGKNWLGYRLLAAAALKPVKQRDLDGFNRTYIDHRTGSQSAMGRARDDAPGNLRSTTHAENMRNRKISIRNKSGISGVRWYAPKHMWQVDIGRDGKCWVIGHYDDFDEAVIARLVAETVLYGDVASAVSRPHHKFHALACEIRDDLQAGGARYGKVKRKIGL